MQKQTTFPATLEAASQFTEQLESWMSFLPVDVRTPVVLAIHELLVNIVEHAYAGSAGSIDVELDGPPQKLSFRVRDYATTGFTMPKEVLAPSLIDLPEGGMGLYIIHQSFDVVDYQHLGEGNLWQLVKYLGG